MPHIPIALSRWRSSASNAARRIARGRGPFLLLIERWMPRVVVAPLFAANLFFVYGFIARTFYISFTNSGVLTDYGFAGLAQYERLWATPL